MKCDISRFSSLSKLLRTFAFLKRFVHNTRNPNNKRVGDLTSEELSESECSLIVVLQKNDFSNASNSKLMRQLNVFTDEKGLIRCAGRIKHSKLSHFKNVQFCYRKNLDFHVYLSSMLTIECIMEMSMTQ